MRSHVLSLFACLLALRLALACHAAHATGHLFVVTTDFASRGDCAALDLDPPWPAAVDLEPVGPMPAVRHFGGFHWVVGTTPNGSLQVIDPATFATVHTIQFDPGSNPRDVVAVEDGTAFVSFYDRAALARIDVAKGTVVASIDLAAFADPDGLPEMGCMERDGNHLFVQLERIDRTMTPVEWNGRLAVIDIPTNTLVDADAAIPGTQAIELAWSRPQFPMQIEGRRLWVAEPGGFYDHAGGIESIDLDTLVPHGLVYNEKDMGLGHMGGFVFVSATRGYVLHHTDLLQSSHLVSFSRATGLFEAEHFVSFGLTETVAFDAVASRLFFPDNEHSSSGIRVFDAATGAQLTSEPIPTGLPPRECLVARDAATSAGPIASASRLRVHPNPTRGPVTIALDAWPVSRIGVGVYDVRGARVRKLAPAGPVGAPGIVMQWDGRDAGGRLVPPGVYFLCPEGGPALRPATTAARVQVVR